MAVEETVNNASEAETRNVFSPCVGVLVTADVKVVQYGSDPCLGNWKCTNKSLGSVMFPWTWFWKELTTKIVGYLN